MVVLPLEFIEGLIFWFMQSQQAHREKENPGRKNNHFGDESHGTSPSFIN